MAWKRQPVRSRSGPPNFYVYNLVMFFADVLQLCLYLAQQFGVLVAVGAQTIILVAHLHELHTPKLHEHEEELVRSARMVRLWALGVIVVSGIIITIEHAFLSSLATALQPVFLFKWLLLVAVMALHVIYNISPAHWKWGVEGILGAVWYTVLIIHIAAPATSWTALLVLFAVWAVAFVALWIGVSALMHGVSPHTTAIKILLPKIAIPKPSFNFKFKKELPPAHKIDPETLPMIVPVSGPVVTPAAPTMAILQNYIEGSLPHVRVMPRTAEQAEAHFAHA